MGFGINNRLRKYRQVLGVAVAAAILAAIFVPFQKAEAYSFNVVGLDGTTHETTAGPFSFTIRLVVEAAEHVPVQKIAVLVDGTTTAEFDMDANQISGTPNGVVTLGAPSIPSSASGYGYSYGYGFSYGYGYGLIGGYGYGATNAPFLRGFIGPVTVDYPASVKPALLTPGTHTFQAIIFTGAGSGSSSQIFSTPVSFTVNSPTGSGTLNVNAQLIAAEGSGVLTGRAIELRQGLTLVETKFTPATLTLVAGQTYTVYATDFGDKFFVQWSDGTTTRGHSVTLTAGQTQTLTALYKTVSSPATLSITAKRADTGATLTGMFNQVTLGSSTTDIVGTGFTPISYTLEPNKAYTAFASDFGQFVFDRWENAASPGVALPSSVNLRGTAVNIGSGGSLSLVAVYRVAPVATVAVSSSTVTFNNVAVSGLPGSGAVTIEVTGAQGTGNLYISVVSPSALPSNVITVSGSAGVLTSGGTSFTTSALVEVDTSALRLSPTGSITLTLPFALPSGVAATAQNVKVFHYNGAAWVDITVPGSLVVGSPSNTGTIQGRITGGSASPVAVGFTTTTTTTSPTTGGGGFGGGGGGVVVDLTTYPESYFVINPLKRLAVLSTALINAQGFALTEASVGQQIVISSSFRNNQQVAQEYAYIVQVTDQDGVTTDIGWQTGKVESGSTVQLSRSWTAQEPGVYTVKIFLWNKVTGTPLPLSEVTVKNIGVR